MDTIELQAAYVDVDDFSQMKKLADEKELLGIYVSNHPLKNYRDKLRTSGCVTMTGAQALIGKNKVKSAAIIQSIKIIQIGRASCREREYSSVIDVALKKKKIKIRY